MITPEQCRAARALVQLSQKQLAEESCVSLRSIQGFEANERTLQSLAVSSIERVFIARGVSLVEDSDRVGVCIERGRLPK